MKRKILLALIGTVLILCSSAVLAHQVKRIVWNPTDLRIVVKPGESYTQNITLHQNRKAPVGWSHQLQVLVKGDIAPYVTVTQPEFPKPFRKGEQVTVEVTITAPPDIPLTVSEGKIVVKRVLKNGKQFLVWRAAKLPVTITFSDIDLPPFPDLDEDEKTVLGIDHPTLGVQGVPDRVEYWIAETFPESEKTRAALMLSVQTDVAFMEDYLAHSVNGPEDPYDDVVRERVRAVADIRAKASDCLRYVMGANESFKVLGAREKFQAYARLNRLLHAEVYDTRERQIALRTAERPLVASGSPSVHRDDLEQQCIDLNLNPNSFPN